jgi:hypothetical protein
MLCRGRESLLYERMLLVMKRTLFTGDDGWLFRRSLIQRFRKNNHSLGPHNADECVLCDMDCHGDSHPEETEQKLILKYAREQADMLYNVIASMLDKNPQQFFDYKGR